MRNGTLLAGLTVTLALALPPEAPAESCRQQKFFTAINMLPPVALAPGRTTRLLVSNGAPVPIDARLELRRADGTLLLQQDVDLDPGEAASADTTEGCLDDAACDAAETDGATVQWSLVVDFETPLSGIGRPLTFETPLSGFETPLSGFETPLSGFETPLSGFETPLSGIDNPFVGATLELRENGATVAFLPASPTWIGVTPTIRGELPRVGIPGGVTPR